MKLMFRFVGRLPIAGRKFIKMSVWEVGVGWGGVGWGGVGWGGRFFCVKEG